MSELHIISLGAGVQSSTMALMAAKGEVTPMPTCAIFADTQAEPKSVYTWLDWLEKQLPFPVHRVTKGDLGADFLAALKNPTGRCGQPPFYIKNAGDAREGMLLRKCTKEYKLDPIRKMVRVILKQNGVAKAIQWIGISLDEAHRMKESGVRFVKNIFPLVDRRLSRNDCLRWMERNGFPMPPKSACVFCPYHNNGFWQALKTNEPAEFERAVQFERAMHSEQKTTLNGAKIYGQIFLHRSCKPIDQVQFVKTQEPDLFGNECEGMCGV